MRIRNGRWPDPAAESAQARNNLAWLLHTEGEDLEGARKLAARAVAAEPEETDSRDTLGQIEARLRDTDGVAEVGERGGR
jgi:hypothetical protein